MELFSEVKKIASENWDFNIDQVFLNVLFKWIKVLI